MNLLRRVTYAHPWESRNALTKWNPSCTCSTCKGPRYSRKVKHRHVGALHVDRTV